MGRPPTVLRNKERAFYAASSFRCSPNLLGDRKKSHKYEWIESERKALGNILSVALFSILLVFVVALRLSGSTLFLDGKYVDTTPLSAPGLRPIHPRIHYTSF